MLVLLYIYKNTNVTKIDKIYKIYINLLQKLINGFLTNNSMLYMVWVKKIYKIRGLEDYICKLYMVLFVFLVFFMYNEIAIYISASVKS